MPNNDHDPPAAVLDPAASDAPGPNTRDGARQRRDPNEPAAVVGLGASAGGVRALQQFFEDMSPESGLAFVVVMHLSPDFESQLASVLQQKTKMPVMQVTEPVKVKPNHVYVIPPNHQLTFIGSTLDIVPPQQGPGRRVTIDLFFRTLAMAYGQRAVCVILSGSDSDGVIGLKHIRAQGGLTIAQDPNEAEYDSMPVTAISTGMVDWVLPVAQLGPKLLEFVQNENRMKLSLEIPDAPEPDAKVEDAPGGETISDETHSAEDEDAMVQVLADLRAQTGHDFGHYKRATVLRRIARRLQVNSLETLPQYVDFIRTHGLEMKALLQDMLIGVTHFFRDRDAFATLEAHVPQLFAGKKKDDEVRVWVAGSATGEEAYSIAMLLCDHCQRLENPPRVQIFATDIDEQSIAEAREGLYPSMIEADVSPERLREYFVKDHGRYRVRKEIRAKVLFAAHNLLKDAPFSRCDLISCRNLLIYLNGTAQKQVFDIFHFALRAGGLLFLGGAENHGQGQSLFSPVDAKDRLFVRRSTPRPMWKVSMLPLRTGREVVRPPNGGRSRPLPALTHLGASDASAAAPEAPQAGQARREVLFGELHLRLLEEYGPPSVVINDTREIVHLSASAGRYLRFVAGEPTANIVKVIDPALQIELRTALFKASQTGETVSATPRRVHFEGGSEVITLRIRPMRSGDQASGFFLVLFEKEDEAAPHENAPAAAPESISREANEEIEFLKQQLNSTVEQYESANEELKASNEELQAMNEEMRTASEELETSKEELQSVNEEMITVNNELKSSVEELSRTNADLNNLMASSDIGTIFLDRQLRIHRFTPAAQEIFHLIPSDMGRPISDITSALKYEGFMTDAGQVLHDLHTVEREVQVSDGKWYLTRIAPYRTAEDRIAGVVATFIDITRRKNAEEALRHSEAKFRTLSDTAPALIWFNDANGNNQYVNQQYLDFSGKTAEEISGQRWQVIIHPEDRHEVVADFEAAVREQRAFHHVMRAQRYDGAWRWLETTAQPLFDAKGIYQGHVGVSPDVTDRKEAEEALRASEARVRTIADNVPQLIWTNDREGTANYFNQRWLDYTGLSPEESYGPGWQAVVHPEDERAAVRRWQQALARGEVFDAEYRLRGADGEYRWFIGRNVPLRRDGTVLSWFGSATDINDLKKAQARLGETEERFRLLVEGTPDYAMFLLDPGNIITYWSSGAEKVFGWSAAEAQGRKGDIIFTPEDRERGEVEKELGTAREKGTAPDRRWHLRKDGSRFWVDGVMRRIDRPDGSLQGFAKIARDATEAHAAEEALRAARDEMELRVQERTRDLRATNAELERAMRERQQLERELLQISEREKRRIGEDLHDGVCQELTATAFFLKSKATAIAQKNPEAAATLEESAQIVNRNVGLARDLARGLQPAELTGPGLKQALRDLAAQAAEGSEIRCQFKSTRGIRVTDDTIALHVYRIAQEAVTNAVKHSGAKNILIQLDRNENNLCVSVQDDGKGFPPRKRSKGLGLHLMRYRASALGGELKVEKRRSGGMDITCVIPLK